NIVTVDNTLHRGKIPIELIATAYDGYENLIGDVTAQTEFSSDVASDVIVGSTVTFPHASPHTITGITDEGTSGSVRIEVIPAASAPDDGDDGDDRDEEEPRKDHEPDQRLESTGTASLSWLGGIGGTGLAAGTIALLIARRRRTRAGA
ncbi:MAG: hypothetical protein J0H64_02830, partial [Actinobacteria bacterium]|nr:hypothetical protein [Actinomycetota bacterium]